MPANIINHIVLVLDASSSMDHLSSELIKVADNQIEHLALRSKELDQETRITVYAFGSEYKTSYQAGPNKIDCLIYDKDVLRMPSIAEIYKPYGMTPLVDATVLSLEDLAMTPEKYGDHSFLIYVLTDGRENASRATPRILKDKIDNLPENWTLAAFVPDQTGVYEAKRFGFPAQNISVWDTTSVGIDEVGLRIRETTDNFMKARDHAHKTGTSFRGTRNLFSLKDPDIREVAKKLTPLHTGQFELFPVREVNRIDEFVEAHTHKPYKRGQAYYQLSKRETIQPQKQIAILGNGGVYVGREARQLLGLPDDHVKVSPNHNPDYEIFVQSTSDNRKLMPDTKLLLVNA